jgi:transaldolase
MQAQRYFESAGSKTKVLAASLTSVDEVMQLAGVNHITVSPPLLAELAAATTTTARDPKRGSAVATTEESGSPATSISVPRDEAGWRLAFTRSKAGKSEGKIIQAINIFADMQDRLEEMVRTFQARIA